MSIFNGTPNHNSRTLWPPSLPHKQPKPGPNKPPGTPPPPAAWPNTIKEKKPRLDSIGSITDPIGKKPPKSPGSYRRA